MFLLANDTTIRQAANQLSDDTVLAPIIKTVGLCTIRPQQNYYHHLVTSIISQQLSMKAADTIIERFRGLFGGVLPGPEEIVLRDMDSLRGVGLSRQKVTYIVDLSAHILDGRVDLQDMETKSNEVILHSLISVKGIGEWTVHMFLMFCMGRLNVLATGDLGVRNAIRKLYGLDHTPLPNEVKELAIVRHWHPYETVACWYLWQSLAMK